MAKKTISIIGVETELIPVKKTSLRKLNTNILSGRKLYEAFFNNEQLYILHESTDLKTTPAKYKQLTEQINAVTESPVAIWLESLKYYERKRFIEQGVYFIISDKYAFLPTLVANLKAKKETNLSMKLSPVAQYILIFYLSQNNNDYFTISQLQYLLSYSYLAVSRGIIQLEELDLCHTDKGSHGTKTISFLKDKKKLWEKANPYMTSPVKTVIYTNEKPDNLFISGTDALAIYSSETVDKKNVFAVGNRSFDCKSYPQNSLGDYSLEIWKYPPFKDNSMLVVDRLSLYLSMRDNPDKKNRRDAANLLKKIRW